MSYIRIALTFDGGPDGLAAGADPAKRYNTTEAVLDALHDPQIPGQGAIKAAFFVQTHVATRMAWPENGVLPAEADLSKGQRLVRAMGEAGHVVGILNGSARDFERHTDQASGTAPTLRGNLERAIKALQALLPKNTDGSPRLIEFVRGPFGLHDEKCDKTYDSGQADSLMLAHVFWDHQAMPLIALGDFCPGVPVSEWKIYLATALKKAADTVRKKKKPLDVVIQLHDISPVTAANLRDLLAFLKRGPSPEPKKAPPQVPVRFCTKAEGVAECLRAAPKRGTKLTPPGKMNYHLEPRLAATYSESEDVNRQFWDLIFTEGWVNHLYRDNASPRELVTIGVGHLVDDKKKPPQQSVCDALVVALPLHHEGATKDDPKPATAQEKKAARDNLAKSTKVPAGRTGELHHRLCLDESDGLFLFEDETRKLLGEDRVEHVDKHLADVLKKREVGPLSKLPPPVRLALADMIFNIGPGSLQAFAGMFDAIRRTDWERAAIESKRNPDTGGLHKRNVATAELFRAVATLEQRLLPISLDTPIETYIVHPTADTVRIEPMPITLTVEKGWKLTQPIRWEISILFRGRVGNDGLSDESAVPAWTVDFGTLVKGGLLRLDLKTAAIHTDGRSIELELHRSGPVTARNPKAVDVLAMLKSLSE